MIRDPPAEACAMYISPVDSSTIVGEMEERGRLKGGDEVCFAGDVAECVCGVGDAEILFS
jgi:hypothetical protein